MGNPQPGQAARLPNKRFPPGWMRSNGIVFEKPLNRAGWVKAKAARLLGMTPRQIAYRMEKYRLADER